jgi:hypothetical protein
VQSVAGTPVGAAEANVRALLPPGRKRVSFIKAARGVEAVEVATVEGEVKQPRLYTVAPRVLMCCGDQILVEHRHPAARDACLRIVSLVGSLPSAGLLIERATR